MMIAAISNSLSPYCDLIPVRGWGQVMSRGDDHVT